MTKLEWLIFSLAIMMLRCERPPDETGLVEIDLETQPQTVEIFAPGAISTPAGERDLAISQAGDEIFFTLGTFNNKQRALAHTHKTSAGWQPVEILPFSGKYNDIEPCLSPDEKRLFFASNRPMDSDTTRKDYNIWYAERTPEGWAEPVALDTTVNKKINEFYPSIAASGHLYYTTAYENAPGNEDIFISRFQMGMYGPGVPLDTTINTPGYEYNAYISPDEQMLIFGGYGRKDGLGGGDIYISHKNADGKWQKAIPLPKGINSDQLDYCPYVDMPRGNFYFTSGRAPARKQQFTTVEDFLAVKDSLLNGLDNLYRVRMSALPKPE